MSKSGNASLILSWDSQPILFEAPEGTESLVGIVFGRMRVVGFWKLSSKRDKSKGRKGNQWVCRCTCGRYEVRWGRSIQNPQNNQDSCHKCRDVAFQGKRSLKINN